MSHTGDVVLMIIARLLFGISIITIYPIILLLGKSVIQDSLLSFRRRFHMVTESYENRSHVGLTIAWITVTVLIAMFIPNISKVISVIGGISAFFILIFLECILLTVQYTEVRIESILSSCITAWYGNCIAHICKALQRVVRSAQHITGSRLPAFQDTYSTRCHRKSKKIIKDNNHPSHCLFTPLPSRRRGQNRYHRHRSWDRETEKQLLS
ncbi:putative sodium-coupled neutral amino acid transporter 8 [Salvelinus alpinus]